MQRNFIGIGPGRVQHNHRLAARHIGAASRSAGFFTIGFALAVLAGGSLFAGFIGAFKATESTSAAAPSMADAERVQPVDHDKADGAMSVVVSEAPARSPIDAQSAAKPPQ